LLLRGGGGSESYVGILISMSRNIPFNTYNMGVSKLGLTNDAQQQVGGNDIWSLLQRLTAICDPSL